MIEKIQVAMGVIFVGIVLFLIVLFVLSLLGAWNNGL